MDKYWYKRIEWALHNIIAHPVCEVLNIFRLHNAAEWLHSALMPHDEEDYMAVCTQYELDGEDLDSLKAKLQEIKTNSEEDDNE